MDTITLYRRTTENWQRLLEGVGADQWTASTPCTEWDVRTLVNHLVNEQRWMPPLLAGATIAEVGDRFDGDLLGDDPLAAAERAASEAMAAVPPAVAGDRIAHLSYGDEPAAEYARSVGVDLLVHSWDLAAAIGAERALPPELVAAAADWYAPREAAYRSVGVVSQRTALSDTSRQAQLLSAFGRDPAWSAGR